LSVFQEKEPQERKRKKQRNRDRAPERDLCVGETSKGPRWKGRGKELNRALSRTDAQKTSFLYTRREGRLYTERDTSKRKASSKKKGKMPRLRGEGGKVLRKEYGHGLCFKVRGKALLLLIREKRGFSEGKRGGKG